jgi:hypothetical protein
MKKILLVTMVTQETHEVDITQLVQMATKEMGLGFLKQGPESPQYQKWASQVACEGFNIQDPDNARELIWIAPSQIKHVKVVFDTTIRK